ncbi:sensor histidine kinase [Paludibaculum fermentans]|uniref:Histidine kinase domain-containing protein n=1 Tax=Paludibaculum fermentans TaxID=1473598 RepID=A0A7S7NWZ4_PALFE|nr:sensor histidine kinase [Paludibaculum fermentans]QOY90719.1 hypothetical protein IRI77_12465 [Paludibaculum fermentans]
MSSRLPVLLLVAFTVGQAEKLPLKIYTAADGLAHNSINRIVRDSRGYLWFCTSEGLSRFDGYEFHSYGRRDGLPHRLVNDLLETKDGELWIATAGGLCHYLPKGREHQRFRVCRPGNDDRAAQINTLKEGPNGQIWCGTDAGLFVLERDPHRAEPHWRSVDLGMPAGGWGDQVISSLLLDRAGSLWIGAGSGLYRLQPDGVLDRFAEENGLPQTSVTALFQDQDRRIWVGTYGGLSRLASHPGAGAKVVEATYGRRDGLSSDSVEVIYQLADGTMCVGTRMGLSIMRTGGAKNQPIFARYSAAEGLPASGVETLVEDTAGNLWIGTDGSGAAKLTWKAFLSFTASDGLRGTSVDAILEDSAGRLCVLAREGTAELFLNEFDGRRFQARRLALPPHSTLLDWGSRAQTIGQDRDGAWWIATNEGVVRYESLTGLGPAPNTHRENLRQGPVVAVFPTADGGLWVSTTGRSNGLTNRDARNRAFHPSFENLAWLRSSGVALFAQDGANNLWLGLLRFGRDQAEVARLRGPTIERFGGGDNAPSGGVRALYRDRHGRLWVGTNQNGLMVFDHPEADPPEFRRYTTLNGLSSDLIMALTEDRAGRIYAGNGSGVDRLDVATGEVKRYTSSDGLAPGEVRAAFHDRSGALWFGTAGGLSRLSPAPTAQPAPPRIVVTLLRVGGVLQPTSELGETRIAGMEYASNQNDLEIGYASLAFAPGETVRYQYRLEGADSEWGLPSRQRSVHYANLPPGSYRFLVRALLSEGIASAQPASILFVILPPFWMRWWFQLLTVGTAAGMAFWLHRHQVKRLVELERVRTRIATDLHDDIGSSLSQIAILSEVASRRVDPSSPGLVEPLADIAGISRELVDSMSDIVWAIDPERDHLDDLTHRMRRFASDVLSQRNIRLTFHAPAAEPDLPMGADLRRQIFLIFKEAVHNILKHSGASAVQIQFEVDHRWLTLDIVDDGRGFDTSQCRDGHGLGNMRARAGEAGGTVNIRSGPGGTRVTLRIPAGANPA